MKYGIHASVSRFMYEWGVRRTYHVPTFYLDAEVLGLKTEAEVRRFAELMLRDLAGADATATVAIFEERGK
jgi:hypothetical protein